MGIPFSPSVKEEVNRFFDPFATRSSSAVSSPKAMEGYFSRLILERSMPLFICLQSSFSLCVYESCGSMLRSGIVEHSPIPLNPSFSRIRKYDCILGRNHFELESFQLSGLAYCLITYSPKD